MFKIAYKICCKKCFSMTVSPQMNSVVLFDIIKSIIIHTFFFLDFSPVSQGYVMKKELNILENVGNLK